MAAVVDWSGRDCEGFWQAGMGFATIDCPRLSMSNRLDIQLLQWTVIRGGAFSGALLGSQAAS